MSAASIMQALDKTRYEVVPIGITPSGQWLAGGDPLKELTEGGKPTGTMHVAPLPLPGRGGRLQPVTDAPDELTKGKNPVSTFDVDVFFPVLHGPYGEDGTIQGLFDMADVPYVGCGVAASAVGMDKGFMKAMFEHYGLPVVPYIVFTDALWMTDGK